MYIIPAHFMMTDLSLTQSRMVVRWFHASLAKEVFSCGSHLDIVSPFPCGECSILPTVFTFIHGFANLQFGF